jgi:electron transfer flavoprotein beta subunit
MKIIVCVKQVAAIDFHLELNENKELESEDLVPIVNPYDLVAVEEAVRIKEKTDDSRVTLISVGPPAVVELLRKCLAVGADEAIQIWDRSFEHSDPWAISLILAKEIKRLEYDIVLCGRKSIDQNNGQVGTYLAELLGIPHVYAISKLEIENNGQNAKVHRIRERGDREVVVCPIPAVFSVDIELNQPRYPSFPAYLGSLKKEIISLNAKDLEVRRREVGRPGSLTKVVHLSPPKERSKKVLSVDSSLSAEDRLKMVMSGGLGDKSEGEVLDGEPEVIAKKVAEFLVEQGVI